MSSCAERGLAPSTKEIYIEGAMAQHFREGVEELARNEPTQDQVEEFITRYTGLPQQPLILH